MPAPRPTLTTTDVREHVARHVFDTADPAGGAPGARDGVGIELEFLTAYRTPERRITWGQAQALLADLDPLPGGSRLTVEPGGQLELSSARFDAVTDAQGALGADLYLLDAACADRRIDLVALGADPLRAPERIVRAPRYTAMQAFFDHLGGAGRAMMCNTAAIQLNVGLGTRDQVRDRWRRAHAIAPCLIAAFANSPLAHGRPTGWQSTRLQAWWAIDPTRSAPVGTLGDPVARFTDYALEARVMLLRADDEDFRPVVDLGLTFGRWLISGHELGWPTLDDLAYHLTTLFPPVRPRGWFELRYIDALPTPFWQVAVAVASVLLQDPEAGDEAEEAVAGTESLWIDAAQLALGHPALADAARRLFRIAIDALAAKDDEANAELTQRYASMWVERGRTPADDRLDAWRRDGTIVPPRSSPVPYVEELDPTHAGPRERA